MFLGNLFSINASSIVVFVAPDILLETSTRIKRAMMRKIQEMKRITIVMAVKSAHQAHVLDQLLMIRNH